jgi:excisionase family DNA binding protein
MSRRIETATLTAEEGRALLGQDKISRGSFYAALKRNEIPHIRLGKRILIPRGAFMRWLDAAGRRESGEAE